MFIVPKQTLNQEVIRRGNAQIMRKKQTTGSTGGTRALCSINKSKSNSFSNKREKSQSILS